MKKILLLGHTGKMGSAIQEKFKEYYYIIGKNSEDFNACNLSEIESMIIETKPDIVINTVAMLGIDNCELNYEKAFLLNAMLPKRLAELSNQYDFLFVHFSTESVFNNNDKGKLFDEDDKAEPINVYGITKYGGECFIKNIGKKYYILRTSMLFGKSSKNNQLIEKIICMAKEGGEEFKISDDVYASPSYNLDIADALREIIEGKYEYGLYHISNEGITSLYELFLKINDLLNLNMKIINVENNYFNSVGAKNLYTPLRSKKFHKLRQWENAIEDYCKAL